MTYLVGILNITPDSYSDGALNPQQAFEHFQRLMAEGADIIDIGAEATNPKATSISADEEIRRLLPLFEILGSFPGLPPLSLDSRHVKTHQNFVKKNNIAYINDVSGLRDAALIDLVGDLNIKAVVMHSVTVPASLDHRLSEETPAIDQILFWAEATLTRLLQSGLSPEQIILDPGIGFGKSAQQSLNILKNITRLVALGHPLLIGHSRKSFMNAFLNRPFEERDLETAVLSVEMVRQGVEYLRIHSVEATRRALVAHKAVTPPSLLPPPPEPSLLKR